MTNKQLVLIVDDESHVRTFLRLSLERNDNVRVLEAADGESALATASEFQPSLILLDLNMPKMGGLAALRKLRALLPTTQILILTAVATRKAVKDCLENGASGYLRKDTPIEQIFSAIEQRILPETSLEGTVA